LTAPPGPALAGQEPEPPGAGGRRPLLGPLTATVAACGGFAGLNLYFYLLSRQSYPGDSDKASTILQAQDLSHGNVLLHGWILTTDSFITLDQLYYAVATRLVGVRPTLMHSGPAFFAAVLVVVGVLVAVEGRRGAAALAGGAVVVALLALPTPLMSRFYLGTGYHVDTALYALLAFVALRSGRFGWQWALGVVLLAAGLLGDLQIAAFGVAPVFLAGLTAMLRRRDWRSGIAPAAAAVACVALAELARRVIDALGGFTLSAALPTAHGSQLLTNARGVLKYGADLAGLTNPLGMGVPSALLEFHVVGALCMVGCFLGAVSSLITGTVRGSPAPTPPAEERGELWRLDDMLVIAIFGAVFTYLDLALNDHLGFVRYLMVSILFVSVLSGRMVARVWPHLRARWAAGAAALGLAALLGSAAAVGYQLSLPAVPLPEAVLATWLEAHHLHNGVGDYWAASATTVASDGTVTVRPVVTGTNLTLYRYMYESASDWYAGERFQFLVYGLPPFTDVDSVSATDTWGVPAHTYVVGPYRVLVWSHSITLPPAGDAKGRRGTPPGPGPPPL
jgi:hypothetical protein